MAGRPNHLIRRLGLRARDTGPTSGKRRGWRWSSVTWAVIQLVFTEQNPIENSRYQSLGQLFWLVILLHITTHRWDGRVMIPEDDGSSMFGILPDLTLWVSPFD